MPELCESCGNPVYGVDGCYSCLYGDTRYDARPEQHEDAQKEAPTMPDRDPMVCPYCGGALWGPMHERCLSCGEWCREANLIPLSAFLRARIASDLKRLAETGAPYPSALMPSGPRHQRNRVTPVRCV
jgi:hypothetical protein